MKIKPSIFLFTILLLTISATAQFPKQFFNNNNSPANDVLATNQPMNLSKNSANKCLLPDGSFAPQAAACNGVSVTPIRFLSTSRTVFSGTDKTVGVVYKYANAGTAPDGVVVDAHVTVVSYSNNQDANQTTFTDADLIGDETTNNGYDRNLQPNINQETVTYNGATSWSGSIQYQINFYVAGTTTPKIISVAAISIDNDGATAAQNGCAGALTESVTYSNGFNQILIDATGSTQVIGGATVTGPANNQTGIGIGTSFSNAALYLNISQLNWTYAFSAPTGTCTNGTASPRRLGSLNMDCQIAFTQAFKSVALSGTVFNDPNGITGGGTVDGTGSTLTGLFANLLDSNGNIVASVPVSSTNGTYTFPTVVPGSYRVQISTNQGVESSVAPALALPAGYAGVGEHLGTGAGGTVTGLLPVTVAAAAITNANFGIELRPVANTNTALTLTNPGGAVSALVPATTFTASDTAPGTVTGIRITAFPSNATSITIGTTTYYPNAGSIPAICPTASCAAFPGAGVIVATNTSGNPTTAISVDPIDGTTTVGVPFVSIDNAGAESSSPGTANIPFTAAPTASNALISGKLVFGGVTIRGALVVLVNGNSNQREIVRTDADGNYEFTEVVGNTYVIQPLSSKYSFSPSNRLVNLREDALTEDFSGIAKNYRPKNDYDGDGKSDLAVYRASEGNWYVLQSSDGQMSVFKFGIETDIPVSADFDGDGRTDYAVYRQSEGNWYIWQSSTQTMRVDRFGLADDKLVPADYDGDGKADVAVYRDGVWYISRSSNGAVEVRNFGLANDKPSAADFDGDGKADISVYRASEGKWYVLNSSNNSWSVYRFGLAADVQVAGDYDGDGFADIAQFRTGVWYINASTTAFEADQFGQSGDQSIVGDYDGDGRADLTVYKDGVWSVRNSGDGSVRNLNFGLPTDTLVK
jgi:hypothetical protein